VGGAWLGRCSLGLVVTVSVTYKNGSVGVVTVAWRTRSLHIPDRLLGLFKPPKVQVKQVTNCTLNCVVFSWPGRHGFGHIQEWVSRCGHTVYCAPVHDLVRSRPGQLAHGQMYYGLFSGPVPITANVDYSPQRYRLSLAIWDHLLPDTSEHAPPNLRQKDWYSIYLHRRYGWLS